MGCASSKVDDLPAVALCHDRLRFLEDAINQRYELAESHVAYLRSLKSVGYSLHRFFDHDPDLLDSPPSPVLSLPRGKKKGDIVGLGHGGVGAGASAAASAVARHSDSNSGSHLHVHSDSDDDDASSGSFHHFNHSSPVNNHAAHHFFEGQEVLHSFSGGRIGAGEGRFMHMNFMRSRAMPSVSYQQRPVSTETAHMGEASYYYNQPAYPSDPSSSVPHYGYSNYESGAKPTYDSSTSAPFMPQLSSQPPPPPPSPPKSSQWDYFNLFDSTHIVDSAYPPSYTSSRNSKDVREEEGIPDLEEEEDNIQYSAADVHGKQQCEDVGAAAAAVPNYSNPGDCNDHPDPAHDGGETIYQASSSSSIEEEELEFEVHMMDKKAADNQKSEDHKNVGAFKAQPGLRGIFEVFSYIKVQFESASESGNDLSRLLEVGILPYRKNAVNQVSSKMLHVISPSLAIVSSQPKGAESNSSALSDFGFEEELGMRSTRLSSTLRKCYLWEKKLYDEVKAEEKLRIVHERKCRKLKRLEEKGAESHKIDSTVTLIRGLSTKIQIAIQVVDKISVNINNLRDEELWPLINELIQGLTQMWKSMLESHQSQTQAIKEARNLDAIALHRKFTENHIQAMTELERDLRNFTERFSLWIHTQKAFVKALNNWLMKHLLYEEPESTPDGIPPFSPGRLGTPPLFVICNQWCRTLERVSEKEVVDSMKVLVRFWEHGVAQTSNPNPKQSSLIENKDSGKRIPKGVLVGLDMAGVVSSSAGDGNGVLQTSLERIFLAMEELAGCFVKAYDELLKRSEEQRCCREEVREGEVL